MCTREQPQGYYVTGKMGLDKDTTSFLPLRIFLITMDFQSIFSQNFICISFKDTCIIISYASIVSSSSSSFKYLLMACEILTSYLNRRVKKSIYPDQDPAVFELV